jgi:hypothetical protein
MTLRDDRTELGRRQYDVLRSILSKSAPAMGMQLENAAATLAAKRRREVGLAAPVTAASVGDQFSTVFNEYASRNEYPARGGPLADAAGFVRYCRQTRQLSVMALREGMLLEARVGFPVRISRIERSLVVAVRLGRVRACTIARW